MNRRSNAPSLSAILVLLAFFSWAPTLLFAQTYTNKITTTPAYIQDNFGPAGTYLPYGGQEFCVPTADAMSLAYLGVNGFTQLSPASPTQNDGLNLTRVLSGLAGTTTLGGTYYSSAYQATAIYLAAKGISTANFTQTDISSPTLSQLASLNQANTVVDLDNGYYNINTGAREGGHCIALLAQGINSQGQSSPNTIVVNNPYPGTTLYTYDVPSNSLQYLNTIPTTGLLTGDGALMLDPSQSPNFWGNTRFVIEQAVGLSINSSQLAANNPTAATWTLTTTQTINLQTGYLSVLATIAGAGGISLGQSGWLEMKAVDNSTGANTLGSGIWQSDVTSNHPFGSGSMTIQSGTLQLLPASGTADINLTVADNASSNVTYSQGGTIGLNRNGNDSLTFTLGGYTDGSTANLVRSGTGTLVIAAASGTANLGTATLAGSERLFVNGTLGNLPTLTNGIVNVSIVGQDSDTYSSGDFLTYGTYGFAKASYVQASATNIASAGASAVFDANTNQTLSSGSSAQVYALKVDSGVTVNGTGTTTLTVGSQLTGSQAGLILNGGTIGTTYLNFGAAEATIYTSNAGGTINSIVLGTGGLTLFGPGSLTLAGANTYSGTTTINSGTLVAASSTATGNSVNINIYTNGTLQINANAIAGKTGSTTALNPGGTLFLNGGTLAGYLTMNSGGGTITGQGTFTGNVNFSGGTIAASSTMVNNLTFAGTTNTISGTIYTWQLNALVDSTNGTAGVNWSLVRFTSSGNNIFGISGTPIYYNLGLANGLADPNSGNAFWNAAHTWLMAESSDGFYDVYWDTNFPTYAQGYFSLSSNSNYSLVYMNYTPTPEPPLRILWVGFLLLLGLVVKKQSPVKFQFTQIERLTATIS